MTSLTKTTFLGPFTGSKEVNDFINKKDADHDVIDVLVRGDTNTVVVTYCEGSTERVTYEWIEIKT